MTPTLITHASREWSSSLGWTTSSRHFLSESSVYRILKAEDLITSPAYVVLSAAKTFAHPTHRPNELWQTDFTYL